MGFNPCDSLQSSLDSSLGKMNLSRTQLNTLYGETESSITNITSPAAETLGELNIAESSALSDINSAGSAVSTYTGSCLKSVSKSLSDITTNTGGAIGGILESISSIDPDINNMVNALAKISGLQSLIETLKIGDLVKELDEFLTCIEGANCVDVGTIQGYLDQVDGFLNDFSLSDSGELKTDTLMNTLGIDSDIKDSITNGITKVTQMKKNITSAASNQSGLTTSSIWNKVKNSTSRF